MSISVTEATMGVIVVVMTADRKPLNDAELRWLSAVGSQHPLLMSATDAERQAAFKKVLPLALSRNSQELIRYYSNQFPAEHRSAMFALAVEASLVEETSRGGSSSAATDQAVNTLQAALEIGDEDARRTAAVGAERAMAFHTDTKRSAKTAGSFPILVPAVVLLALIAVAWYIWWR